MNRKALLLGFIVLLWSSAAYCQIDNQLNTGYPENGVFHGSEIESVQITNGGLRIEIPIYSAKARGMDVWAKVIYNSKSWTFRTRCFTSGGGFCEDDVSSDPLGHTNIVFASSFDYMFNTKSTTCQAGFNLFYSKQGGYSLREPNGTKHHFSPDPLITQTSCVPPVYPSRVYADDGSGWTMDINTADGSIIEAISKNGTRVMYGGSFMPSLIVDANGNQEQPQFPSCCVTTSGWGGIDTLGRTIPANGAYYDSSGTLQTPVLSGSVSVAVDTTPLCLFATADTCVPDKGTQILPAQLQLPNGDVFNFTYDPNGAGEPASMTLPTGGKVSFTWGIWGEGGRNVASRTVSANGVTGIWNYNLGTDGGGIVTDPALKDTRYTCGSGTCSKEEYFDGPAGASPLIKTITTDYTVLGMSGVLNGIPLPIRQTVTWSQLNLTMKTETDWDTMAISGVGTVSWSNPVEKRIFDWGSNPASLSLLQRTHSSFRHLEADGGSYLSFNIADLPTLVQTYDGAGNLLAQAKNTYDGSALTGTGTCQAPGVPNHDYCNFSTSNLVRGNATQVSHWINTSNTWINTTNTYDDLGNVRSTLDPLMHPTTFDYTDSWGGTGCVSATSTLAFLTTVTNARGQRVKTSYYPCTSLVQSKRDENDIIAGRPGTTMTYDLLNRPLVTQTLDVGGQILAKTSWSYNDSVLPLSMTKTVTASPSPDIVSTIIMDDLGRTSQTIQNDPEGNVTSEITYDTFGRQSAVTNPHRSVAAATDGTIRYAYDRMGRVTDVFKPDNNTVHTDYSGNVTTVTDEAQKQRRSRVDGMGRLVEVDEPGDAFAGTDSAGSLTVNGTLRSVVTGGSPATAGSGSVTISGAEQCISGPPPGGGCTPGMICCITGLNDQDWVSQYLATPEGFLQTICDSGTVTITVNGHSDSISYGTGSTAASIASALVNAINADGAAFVNASLSGATVVLTARTTGSGTNYSLSTSVSFDSIDFGVASFTANRSGASLTGGTNAVGGTTTFDSGTASLTVGTFTGPAVSYSSTQNSTSSALAQALATAFTNAPGSPAVATISPAGSSTIALTYKTVGVAGNVTASVASVPSNATLFPGGSFSGTTSLAGGADPYPSGIAHPYVTFYNYDGLNNLICVEQHGNVSGTGCAASPSLDGTSPWRVRRFTYDSLSRLLTAKNPETGQTPTAYQYDNDSNLISKTDARGITINFSPTNSPIDSLHRVTQKTYSDGTPTVTYQYDTGCCGVTPANAAGRMTAAFSGNTELVFSYDPIGRIKTQWDCPPSGIARGFCYVISASYDATGKITSLTYPDNRIVTSAYNTAGRFLRTDLASFNGTPVNFNYYTVPQSTAAATWGYWPTGAMNRGTYGNGVIETTGYNNRLQVGSIVDAKSGTAFFSKNYGYTDAGGYNNGNILTITDTLNAGKTQTFTYDSLNRILSGVQSDNAFNLTYTYDPWGNMKESGTSSFQPLFDVMNRMIAPTGCTPNLTPYCYDASGDLLMDNHNHVYTYDGEARIKTVDGTGAAYTYNPLGNRVRKDAGNTSTEYFFFAGTVIAELNPTTLSWTDYIGYGERIAKDTSNNGSGAQYYHADHIGSARVMTDSSGNVISNCTYNPFGEEVSCSPNNISNHYRFTGKERDNESGLDDFGARYYSSSMGRWATPDWDARPVSVPYANFGDPQSLNLYLYVRNDPVTRADADGHISNDSGGESCLSSFSCYVEYQEHIKDNQPSGWFTVISSFSSEDGGTSEQTSGQSSGQTSNNQSKPKQLTADDVAKAVTKYETTTGTKDKPVKGPARIVAALNELGGNWTVTGAVLLEGATKAYASLKNDDGTSKSLPGNAKKVLDNVASATRVGDKIVISNKDKLTIDVLFHIDTQISFRVATVKGQPALLDLKGISIGLGRVAKHPDHYGP